MKNIGAFLDIDGTLYRNSLMTEHFKKLLKYEVIDPALWHNHVKHTYYDWQKRRGNYDDYLLELAEIYINSLKGLNKSHLDFINNQVINLKGDKVYRYTRSRIAWHKSQNHKVFFISGSPEYLVEKMAEKYDITDYRGTKYMIDENNNFTGEIVQMWDSESKHKVIMEFVKKYNIDLSKSYSYGDTNGDYSMLKIVGNPIAINPSKELLENIKRDKELLKRVTIIVERKDVIYTLDGNVEIL
ncbi:HAD family hydrolase [Paramaledivibacter caminithermalis]|jgi:HAD superfamily hydrolase (TIGR01490 family)|uniref:phosphoserine phosphatase n=1 Tax=Paramaledivibacter caminithermalis (strain DSM 15212 / CIP 107654 / DViRD3) TaxID=1121301 RepID=A0A1M6SLW8_PARC5|nr:HAD-IB family hydrolase [Paramaledivibacter caminithermalis]SHK45636.1 HAD-superfamily subfamily IB hydrolase, TIGR01490 [Paramaledivibacter caminithermalis DSM 15212]